MNVRRSAIIGISVVVAASWAAPVRACLNDRDSDSLAEEGGKLPHVVQVITGRFERNPPLYYQMRRDRVAREIARHPQAWTLYDDAAVASDRLHEEEQALGWIARKRAAMERAGVSAKTAGGKEAWYRYHANAGTFWAHRYLQAGAKPAQIGEMRLAIRHIEKALALKPDAHFGRERYQLAAMRWIADLRGNGGKESTAYASQGLLAWVEPKVGTPTNVDRAVEGLCGLVVLGNAWESVDVFSALALSLASKNGKLAYLANLRREELQKAGRRSLDPKGRAVLMAERRPRVTNEKNLRAKYADLRAEADRWQAVHTAYLMAGLKAGRHPDTDADFWQGFRPAPVPTLDIDWEKEYQDNFSNWLTRNLYFIGLAFLLALVLGPIGVYFGGRRVLEKVRARRPEPAPHPPLPSGR